MSKKEIKDIKERLTRLETQEELNKIKTSGVINRIFGLIVWLILTIPLYVFFAIYRVIKVSTFSREKQISLKKYHIENRFNEPAYLWGRLFD